MALGPGLTERRIDQADSKFYVNFRNPESDYEKRLKDYKVGLLPFIEEKIKNNEIKFINDFYASVDDDNSNLTDAEKQRVKAEFKALIDTTFQSPTDDVLKVLILARANIKYEDKKLSITGEISGLSVLNSRLKLALEKKINANVETGFAEFFRYGDYQSVDDLLESVAQTGNVAELKSAQAGAGKDSDSVLSKASPLEVRQCALMSTMYSEYDIFELIGSSYDSDIFDGRIMSFTSGIDNPTIAASQINNYFTADNQITDFFKTNVQDTELNKSLFFVYHDVNDGLMKEIKLKLSSHDDKSLKNKRLDQIYQAFLDHQTQKSVLTNAEIANLNAEKRAIFATLTAHPKTEDGKEITSTLISNTATIKVDGKDTEVAQQRSRTGGTAGTLITDKTKKFDEYNNFHTEKISIKFNGTNPSTARNDVQVSIVIQLETFAALETSLIEGKIASTGRTDFKVKDLVIAPIGDDSKTGALAAITNIYSPSSNRIRLKVKADDIKLGGKIISQPPLILDLALVDHTLERASDSNAVTLTINYRGYMETLMQMPFANVLMTKDIYKSRKKRHQNIKKLLTLGCNDSTLREILRIERSTAENEIRNNFSSILRFLFENKRVYSYAKKENSNLTFEEIASNLVKYGKSQELTIHSPIRQRSLNFLQSAVGVESDEVKNLEEVSNKGVAETTGESGFDNVKVDAATRSDETWLVGSAKYFNFVYFGDLLHAVTDILYEFSGDFATIPEIKEGLSFLLFPIQIPDPTSSKKFIEFNPMEIPIDLYFFAEWWHETIVKKELTNYPMASFMRDLAERLINNLLFEVCVSNLLPDEQPPMLKVSYFSSEMDLYNNGSLYKRAKEEDFNGLRSYETTPKPFFLYEFDPKEVYPYKTTNSEGEEITSYTKVINNYNYIVMHVVSPPFRREIAVNKDRTNQLRNSNFVPTLIHGVFTRDKGSHVDNVTFSKTNSPGLREARYFNNTFGNVAIMNNVYDLSFSIQDNNANTYLYPGMIINFVLTDFEMGHVGIDTDGDNKADQYKTAKVDHITYINTENDPHNPDSLAHTLGYGGYFLIKSVSYELLKGSAGGKWQLTCEAKFIGTDGDQRIKQDKRDVRTIVQSDKPDCIDVYDAAVKENQTAIQNYNNDNPDEQRSQEFTKIGSENSTYVADDDSPPPAPEPATNGGGAPKPGEPKQEIQTTDDGPVVTFDVKSAIKSLKQAEKKFVNENGKSVKKGPLPAKEIYVQVGDTYYAVYDDGTPDAPKVDELDSKPEKSYNVSEEIQAAQTAIEEAPQ